MLGGGGVVVAVVAGDAPSLGDPAAGDAPFVTLAGDAPRGVFVESVSAMVNLWGDRRASLCEHDHSVHPKTSERLMGKLKMLRSDLARLKPSVRFLEPKTAAEQSRDRDARLAYRSNYKTARWQRLAWSVKVRDAFTCQRCGLMSVAKFALAVDHVIPHRGNEMLFWDEGNLSTLCAPCHNGAKQREEAKQRR